MRSPAWGRRCAQPSTGAGRSQAPSGTGNFACGCHVHEGVPAGPLGNEEGISGTARGPPCPLRMARCSVGTPCPGQAPGPGPASSRPPSVDSAWGGAGRAGRRGAPPRPGCCWPRCPGPGCAAATPDAETALRATAPGPCRAYGPGSFSSVPFGHRRVFMERLVHLGVWRCTGVAASSGQRRMPADRGPRFQARVRPAAGRRGWGRREVPTAGPEGRSSPAPSRRGVYPGCRASSSRRTFKSLFVIAKAIYVYYKMLWKCHVFKKCGKETSKPVMDAVAHEWLPPCVPRCPYVAALTAS